MMKRLRAAAGMGAVVLLLAPASVCAGARDVAAVGASLAAPAAAAGDTTSAAATHAPAPARWQDNPTGPVLTMGVGFGSGRVTYPELVDGARFADNWRGGTSLDVRLEWPLASRVTVGAALDAWFGSVGETRDVFGVTTSKDDGWGLWCICATAAWHPVGGLFVRGGLGRASASTTFSDFEGFEQILRDHGLGWRAAAGYEIGVARDFALVPTVEWRGFELGSDNRARIAVLTLAAAFAL